MDLETATSLVREASARHETARQRVEMLGMLNVAGRSPEERREQAEAYSLAIAEERRASTAMMRARTAYADIPYVERRHLGGER
jgi:hypothetical protein